MPNTGVKVENSLETKINSASSTISIMKPNSILYELSHKTDQKVKNR